MQELADQIGAPLVYLVDAAGARIDEQFDSYAGRHAWGNIFFNLVAYSGRVPQVCALFGPSPAGSAYVPALCDLTIMVREHATMYLGAPRLAEMVTGEKVTLEEMGGADMHCRVSGRGRHAGRERRGGHRRDPGVALVLPADVGTAAAVDHRVGTRRAPFDRRHRARPRGHPVRHAGADRRARRRGHVLPLQGPLRPGTDHRSRPPRRAARRHRRQPDDAQGRRAVQRLVGQGNPVHLDLQRVQRPAAVPDRHLRLHDRLGSGARGHHPTRRQDALRGVRGDGAADRRRRAQGVWRRLPGDVGQPHPSRRGARPAHRQAGADGAGGGRQRDPLQPGDGDRGSRRAGGVRRRRTGQVRGRHRCVPAGQRERVRDRRTRRPAACGTGQTDSGSTAESPRCAPPAATASLPSDADQRHFRGSSDVPDLGRDRPRGRPGARRHRRERVDRHAADDDLRPVHRPEGDLAAAPRQARHLRPDVGPGGGRRRQRCRARAGTGLGGAAVSRAARDARLGARSVDLLPPATGAPGGRRPFLPTVACSRSRWPSPPTFPTPSASPGGCG